MMSAAQSPAGFASGRRATSILLLVIVSAAAWLRWHSITDRGFFFDELWILEVAKGRGSEYFDIPLNRAVEHTNTLAWDNARPIWQVPAHTTGVLHPPGTFVSLRAWCELFGDSMLAMRSHSAMWSLLVVFLSFVATAQSFGRRAGLCAAALSALSLGNIDQAQDTRGYTMLQALMLLTIIGVLRLRGRRSDWKGAAAIGAGTLAMMFTHYFAAGPCVGIVLAAMLLLRGVVRWQVIGAIVVAGALWIALWWPSLRSQLAYIESTADTFLLDRSNAPLVATILRLIASPYQALVADPRPESEIPLLGGATVWLLLLVRMVPRQGQEPIGRGVSWMWAGLVGAGIAVLLAMDVIRQSKHLEFPKYLQIANPPLCVLLGSLAIGAQRRWLLPATLAGALACTLLWTPRSLKPDLRPHLAWLREHASPDDLILLPAQLANGRDGQTRFLSVAHGVQWPNIRLAIPLGPQSAAWVDQLPRDGRWFCLTFNAYDVKTWLPGATVIDQGPQTSGVSAYVLQPPNSPDARQP